MVQSRRKRTGSEDSAKERGSASLSSPGKPKPDNTMKEMRQLNEQLKESEERYHGMIAEVQDYAIILLSKKGEVQTWNAGAAVIKGYSADEIIGKHFSVFYPEEDRKNKLPYTLLRRAAVNGKANHEGWRVRKDGSRFWGSIVITALHNSQGDIIGFSKVTRDLTEKKMAEEALKASAAELHLKNKRLEQLNEELSSFTHVASHDMKEPLRKIRSYAARILSDDVDLQKAREYVHKIMSSASRMQALIDDLLSYSRLSDDTSAFEKVDLNATVTAVLADLEVAISEKNAVIKVGKLPTITGIAHQLQQLFLNLISNAIKFAKPGQPPSVTIRAEIIGRPEIPGIQSEENTKYHHITVTDSGIGFSPEQSSRIFEPFHRLHAKDKIPGTGIGLAIVKRIMQNHRGIVSAEGQPDAGATFHLYLPCLRREKANVNLFSRGFPIPD